MTPKRVTQNKLKCIFGGKIPKGPKWNKESPTSCSLWVEGDLWGGSAPTCSPPPPGGGVPTVKRSLLPTLILVCRILKFNLEENIVLTIRKRQRDLVCFDT